MQGAWRGPRRSLAGRLALAVTGAVGAALILASALSVWLEVERYTADNRRALDAVAQVFAYGGARATAAGDVEAAQDTLRAIARVPNITYGAIVRPDGTVLAEQGIGLRLTRDADLDGAPDFSVWRMLATLTMRADAPILENTREIGRIVLIADTSEIIGRIRGAGLNAGLAGILAVLIGLGVAQHLQRRVTRPLAALARTMDAVRLRHDYGQRASVAGDNEVGALAGAFNELLGAVNERDRRLAEHSEHLEEEVRLRTSDLVEAKQVAESANAAKSTFLATMSHEIRTPMNGVLVMAELLARSELPPRQRRYAEVIARSGQSLLAIINDILDFAKVEAGKMELERVPVAPADLADTVVTLFAERARGAGLDLAAHVAPEVPAAILGDPVRLGQVASNFVSNALKFTQAGHVALHVAVDPADGFLVLSVTDTGIGIPADKLSSIFSAFSQADQSTTRRFGGTGLGLSIAQRLIEAMGGTVGVESTPGTGSRFFVRIPVEAAPAAAAEPPPVRAAEVAPAIVLRLSGAATRESLACGLRAAGFAPGETAAGPESHWIVEAADLVRAGRRPEGALRVIVLGGLGDTAADRAVRAGLADEALRWPVMQADWRPVLSALAAGRPFAGTAAAPEAAEALPRFPRARVLVADDSAVNREVAIEALSRCGVTDVVAVADGAEAVAAWAAGGFDLILMDGSMPVLDGFAAARAIRDREAAQGLPRVPVVALTAHVLGEAAQAWQGAGMDGVLAKPFTLRQLAAILQAHVAGEAAGRPCAGDGAPAGAASDPAGVEPAGAGEAMREAEILDAEILDDETLDSLLGMGDADFFARIVQLYCGQAPGALALLEAADREADQAAVASAAHSLKSMSLNIGARRLAAGLRDIEGEARAGAYAASPPRIAALRGLLERTVEGLKARVSALAAVA